MQQRARRSVQRPIVMLTIAMTVSMLTVLSLAPSVTAVTHYDDILWSSSAHIASGTGSFNGLSETNKTVYVRAGSIMTGEVTMVTENNMLTSDRAPLIGTANWSSHGPGYWTINGSIGTGERSYVTSIPFTAPSSAGTYHIIFAFNAEYEAANVASCTNWRYSENNSGTVVWDDGNDVAGLTSTQIRQLQTLGRTEVNYLFEFGPQSAWSLPGDAITLIVLSYENITGRVTDAMGEPVAGVVVTLDSIMNLTTDETGWFAFEVVAGEGHTLTLAKDGYETRDRSIEANMSKDQGNLIIKAAVSPQPSVPDWIPIAFAVTGCATVVALLALRRFR